MKIFCSECGNKHEYTAAKPKFCSECGNPLSVLTAKRVEVVPEPEQEIEEVTSEFNVSLADFEIETDIKRNKIGDIVDPNSGPPQKIISTREGVGKVNKTKFLNEFKKEAGTLRKK